MMNEKFVNKNVMNGNIVQNIVINAKIDPKVAMDLYMFKIGGWNHLEPKNQKSLEVFLDENQPWLLIGIPKRDPFLVTQHLDRHPANFRSTQEKLMSLRESLHAMMQCYMRQDFADRYWLLHEHPGRHAS